MKNLKFIFLVLTYLSFNSSNACDKSFVSINYITETAPGVYEMQVDWCAATTTAAGGSGGDCAGVEDGSVLKEELREINISLGAEYLYNKIFAVRAGYFHEHYSKGNRRYVTMGVGLKYSKFELDFSYLVTVTNQNPLANTIRFSLAFNLGKASAKSAQ